MYIFNVICDTYGYKKLPLGNSLLSKILERLLSKILESILSKILERILSKV